MPIGISPAGRVCICSASCLSVRVTAPSKVMLSTTTRGPRRSETSPCVRSRHRRASRSPWRSRSPPRGRPFRSDRRWPAPRHRRRCGRRRDQPLASAASFSASRPRNSTTVSGPSITSTVRSTVFVAPSKAGSRDDTRDSKKPLRVQGRLHGAHAVAELAFLELVARVEVERLAERLLLGARESADLEATDPRFLPASTTIVTAVHSLQGLARVSAHVGRQIAFATQAAEDFPLRAVEARGLGRPPTRARRRSKVGGVEPSSPVHFRLSRTVAARHETQPDAAGLVDRLDLDLVEDARHPEAVEALTYARARTAGRPSR